MRNQKEKFGIGDGRQSSIPKIERRNYKKMKIKDEMKMDLKLSSSRSGSNRSRFKLYPIEEVSENSCNSQTSNSRCRIERDAEIQRTIEENKKLGMNRPKSSHKKFMPKIEIKELKPVSFNYSEESVMASVFEKSPNEEEKPLEFIVDTKIAQLDAAVNELLAYKHSQISRLAVASSYEYHKLMLRKNFSKTSSMEPLSIPNTTSTISTFNSQTTSCFGKLFCSFKKSRR